MIISIHQPQYMPWLGFFHKMYQSDVFILLNDAQYKKGEYQNRASIRAKDGLVRLTVPVLKKGKALSDINNVFIDVNRNWRKKHWKALYYNYGGAAYFGNYSDFFENLYKKEWKKLADLNIFIIKYLNEALGIKKVIRLSSEFNIKTASTRRIVDICKALKADTYVSGAGGRDYLEEDRFKENSIKLVYQDFKHPRYTQFDMKCENDFIPYLSIIDLIFNYGPDSLDILMGK